VSISGDLALQPTSVLEIEVGPIGNGFLNVDGNLALDGTLNVIQLDGFAPLIGQTFTFVSFATETGTFANIDGTTIGNGLLEKLSLDSSDTNDLRLDVISTAAIVPPPASAGSARKGLPV
jgi:hypothetical protein